MKIFSCFLAAMLMLSATLSDAAPSGANLSDMNQLFKPLPDNTQPHWTLIQQAPIPLRIQYNGFVEHQHHTHYIFMVEGEMVSAALHETTKQQFTLKQVLQKGNQVLIEDLYTQELHILTSGQTAYIPGKFRGILQNNVSGQRFSFSDTKNGYKTDTQEILISQKDGLLYISETDKGKKSRLYCLPLK